MCGIVGVLARPSTRSVPTDAELTELLDRAVAAIGSPEAMIESLTLVNALLLGVPGVAALADRRELVNSITDRLARCDAFAAEFDAGLEAGAHDTADLERLSAISIALRDVLWAIRHDRLRTAVEVSALAGRNASLGALSGYLAVQQALSAIDRLEVRGRDSAGLHVLVRNHGLDLDAPAVAERLGYRTSDPLFTHGSVRTPDGHLGFVYKPAAEIGELGDNTATMRAAIAAWPSRTSPSRSDARLAGGWFWPSLDLASIRSMRISKPTIAFIIMSR